MPKLRVTKTTAGDDNSKTAAPPPLYNKARYAAWGDQSDTAHTQWYPETAAPDVNGNMIYKSKYDLMNKVMIPNQNKMGQVVVIGNPKGMTLGIRDGAGKMVHTYLQNVSPKDIQAYFTNKLSPVAQRQASIQAGTNPDAPDTRGTFAAY